GAQRPHRQRVLTCLTHSFCLQYSKLDNAACAIQQRTPFGGSAVGVTPAESYAGVRGPELSAARKNTDSRGSREHYDTTWGASFLVWVARRRGAPLGSRETFFTLTLLSQGAIPRPPNQDQARLDILRRLGIGGHDFCRPPKIGLKGRPQA